jgi:hypothetical protein
LRIKLLAHRFSASGPAHATLRATELCAVRLVASDNTGGLCLPSTVSFCERLCHSIVSIDVAKARSRQRYW